MPACCTLQRDAIAEAVRDARGIVVEGRDIGSVVAPNAPVKVYLTADASARAVRQATEEGGSDDLATRSRCWPATRSTPGRATAPLIMADGAVHIDTTPYSLAEVIDLVVDLVEAVEARA